MKLKIVLLIFTVFMCFIKVNCKPMFEQQKIIVVPNGSKYFDNVVDLFLKLGINYEIVDSVDPNNNQLHIFFDLFNVNAKTLPKYYVAYQTLDLNKFPLTEEYISKLANAVVIWDFSRENIAKYPASLSHYYYLPKDYEFADPVILPCFLQVHALSAYKEIVKRSNEINNEIASHLPILFCYSILQNPKILVEAGVDIGRSTYVFRKVLELIPASLLGLDIASWPRSAYENLKNATFINMDDRNFYDYYMTTKYKNDKIDFVFIDTSHEYLHTMQEIMQFAKLLEQNGILSFHDSNVTPENNGTEFVRLNGTRGRADGNTRGVTQAIKEYFEFEFDEHKYVNSVIQKNGVAWHMVHYPFCNGLTIIRLIGAL